MVKGNSTIISSQGAVILGAPTNIIIPSETQNCPGNNWLPGIVVAGGGGGDCGFGVCVFDGRGVCVGDGNGVGVSDGGTGVCVSVGTGVAVTTTTAVTTTVSLSGVALAGIGVCVGNCVNVCNAVGGKNATIVAVGDTEPNPKFEPKRMTNATHNKTPIAAAAAMAR